MIQNKTSIRCSREAFLGVPSVWLSTVCASAGTVLQSNATLQNGVFGGETMEEGGRGSGVWLYDMCVSWL